jgi:entericidin B
MIRKSLIAVALAAITLSATACNTVQGVGDDVKSVGRAGERAID